MLNVQRSVISFIVIIVFGIGAAIVVVKKGNDAADELERLNSRVFAVHRAALAQGSDDESGSGIVDTSNWKTYRNEKYGFEMKYPEFWEVYDHSSERMLLDIAIVSQPKQPPASFDIKEEALVDIPGYQKKWRTAQEYAMVLHKPFHERFINGSRFIEVREKSIEGDESVWLFSVKGNRLFQIIFFWFNGFESFEPTFQQMLSTFKFIK